MNASGLHMKAIVTTYLSMSHSQLKGLTCRYWKRLWLHMVMYSFFQQNQRMIDLTWNMACCSTNSSSFNPQLRQLQVFCRLFWLALVGRKWNAYLLIWQYGTRKVIWIRTWIISSTLTGSSSSGSCCERCTQRNWMLDNGVHKGLESAKKDSEVLRL